MTLVGLLIFLIVIGLVLYLIRMIPMDPPIRTAVIVVAVVICIILLLQFAGGLTGLHLR